jgi:RND family efflux transporter MFP subunit
MSRRFLIWLVVAAALAAAGLWWRYGRGVEVIAVAAERGTAVEIVYATGTVAPVRWAKVTSLIRDRIVDICQCEGKAVAKDEVLARLDDRDMQAALRELRAREDFLKREHSRMTELVSRGAATMQGFERASMDLNQVQALIAVQIERISDYTILSPMDGVVLRRDGEIGEIADVGQILFRVGVPKPLEVVAEVNEEDIPRVVVGQKALLRTDAFIDRRLDATVSEITPMGDPITKTYRVRLALPADTPLLPGMSVEANIVNREKPDALLVPSNAVAGNTVFVIDGAVARARKVQAGIRGTRQTEILSGLKDGERVASPASIALKDRRVRIVEPAAEP